MSTKSPVYPKQRRRRAARVDCSAIESTRNTPPSFLKCARGTSCCVETGPALHPALHFLVWRRRHRSPPDSHPNRIPAIDQLRVLADEKQQHLTLKAPIQIHASADTALMRHGLMNLIHNAIKYTPNGGTITSK